jgi:signal transduction histidine kinase/ActR/RegA family two-component response regulator
VRWPARIHRSWRNLPFVQKLAGLLIALVSLPSIVVFLYTTSTSREALIEATRSRNLQRAHATAEVIDAFFNDARADVRTASGLAGVVELCEQADLPGSYQRALRSLRAVRSEQRMVALYVTDETGRVLVATDDRVRIGSIEVGRSFLTAVAGDTAVDDPVYDPFDRRVALRVSHAVRAKDGAIIGTTTALIDVTALDQLTQRDANFGDFGEFGVLWTSVGVSLSHSTNGDARFASWTPLAPDTAVITRQRLGPAFRAASAFDPAFEAVADRTLWLLYDAGTDPHLRVESQTLGALQMTAVPLDGQPWVYGIFVPEARLLTLLRRQMLRDWAVAFFTVLAALTLSVIAARWVTRPLRRVTDTANALARGDMTQRVHLDQRDEFGQLGSAFDAMAAAISDNERQMQAHAANLERRVEERTATLQLLERASRTLASSLELQRTAANLATVIVPATADFCLVDVRDAHGTLKRIASRHADLARDRVARTLVDTRPARDLARTLTPEERAALGLTDVRAYELSAGRQFVGYLTVAMAGAERRFDEGAERIFEELGRRAGLAFANALLYQEAQDANRLKDEFLGVVSHELRTPLNAIMGWTRLARLSRGAGVDTHKALDAVERNAAALARLVDDLLDVPRIIMGKLALDLRPLDLNAVVTTAVDAIRPAAASKSLSVHLQAEPGPAIVYGDPERLQQVFGNILSNSLKFTPPGGRITVRVGTAEGEYGVVVEDSGVGIDQDFLPFVFDRFRQADSSTTRAHGGLGIGLSLVRHLVQMHGGRVTAASGGPGLGSTFSVHLPSAGDAIPDDRNVEPDTRDSAEALTRIGRMRLLVVDDDAGSRDVLTGLLQTTGATVFSAATVADAWGLLEAHPEIDAVLADIGMPGEDGYAFVARLRESGHDSRLRTLPAVAVTADASTSDRQRALAAGFDGHVPKPVSLSALAEALTVAVAARSR